MSGAKDLRVAVYARVSQDPDENETSTARQIESCQQWASARGWEVVKVYRDSGLSAYDEKVVRPQFEQLRADLSFRTFDMVLVWRSDRVFRRIRPFLNFLHDLDQAGVAYAAVMEGFDTTTAQGRLALTILGAFAEYESESTSQRLRSRWRSDAEAGKRHPGGRRSFGYESSKGRAVPVVREDEAVLLREAADRFLSGESLRQIAIDWNGRGILTSAGKQWTGHSLGQTLRSPKLGGYRTHHGQLTKGDWDPVFDEDTFYLLHDGLQDARQRAGRRTHARHLLSGLLRCGLCENPMQIRGEDWKSKKLRYACVKRENSTKCGGVTIAAAETEDQVFEDVVAMLDSGRLREVEDQQDVATIQQELEDALRDDQAALEDLSKDFYVDRIIERREFLAARSVLADRIREREAELAGLRRKTPTPDVPDTPEGLRHWWKSAGLEDRRAFLDAVLRFVMVMPVRRPGHNTYDPERLVYVWRA